MKGKAVVSDGIDKAVLGALRTPQFAEEIIRKVMGGCLGAENPLERPAEYYVQFPDLTIQVKDGFYGVEFRLTGATRNDRTPAQFHKALKVEHEIVKTAVSDALKSLGAGVKVQMFVVIMLDGDIETKPGSGVYSNVIESDAEWVSAPEEK